MPLKPAIFLDRDGVLIKSIHGDYVRTNDQIRLLPGVKMAMRRLLQAYSDLFIVTNQAAVAKNYITLPQAWSIQAAVEQAIGAQGRVVSAICPHTAQDSCECRKPKPGMILDLAARYQINLSASYLIGDSLTDVATAQKAGVTPLMVLTGRGKEQYSQASSETLKNLQVFPSLREAVEYLLNLAARNKSRNNIPL